MNRTRTFLEERRENLRAISNSLVNGFERIEIDEDDKTILRAFLVHKAPGTPGGRPTGASTIVKDELEILGGDRIRGIRVLNLSVSGAVLTIRLNKAGDFSSYILRINRSDFDHVLRDIAFGFRAECPEVFDICDIAPAADTDDEDILPTDYLAKDYQSFRQQMLDRISTLSPEWADRAVPDIGITLVELMAKYADYLSYRQDVAATEAYLNTARLRTSLSRHCRLLGYDVFNGLSSRVFAQFTMNDDHLLDPKTIALTTKTSHFSDDVVSRVNVDMNALIKDNVPVFEPIAATYTPAEHDSSSNDYEARVRQISLKVNHNSIDVHDWRDSNAILPRGATQIWVRGNATDITLKTGDFISIEQARDPKTRHKDDANKMHRQIVRLVKDPIEQTDAIPINPGDAAVTILQLEWHEEDALQFDLAIGHVDDPDDSSQQVALAKIYGNIVLCDHGASITLPSSAPSDGENLGSPLARQDPEDNPLIETLDDLDLSASFRPLLSQRNISVTHIPHFEKTPRSARHLQNINRSKAMPAIIVREATGQDWHPIHSLIDASEDAKLFVPEFERDGRTYLRFPSDESYGAEPTSGENLYAHYRVGRGPNGNIGAETLSHVIETTATKIKSVRNPLSGFGGEIHDSFSDIRIKAPQIIEQNNRAVTANDYAEKVTQHHSVSAARTRKVWHGSWHTLFISVDLVDGLKLTNDMRAELLDYLEPFRLMGQDIQIEEPNFAPLDVTLHICVDKNYLQNDVLKAVREALSARRLTDGRLGFFHPDRLSFGEKIYLSQIYSEVQNIPGVADVKVVRFTRWGTDDETALEAGVLLVGPSEIPILMNDPNYPERGRLTVQAW